MAFRIGIDVGGTFTDFQLMRARGRPAVHKELSTPADPSVAVMAGLAALAAAEAMPLTRFLGAVELIVHGTTVTTNAILTGNTARAGLLTTRGFRDALQMRRGVREQMYDNRYHPPEPLVPRRLRLPVTERVDAEGTVVTPLRAADVEQALERFRGEGVEAVAICFLHAHANSAHEEAAARIVRNRMPRAYLSVSSRVLPQVRFYERTSTTVLNAGVGPILSRYLANLTRRLAAAGFRRTLLVMQSNGGVAAPERVARLPAMTLLSGPAAAPAAGLACMAPRRERSFITVDMGGTSFDAALVLEGEPAVTTRGTVNRYALALPSMEINTIGAGGGSVAWIDEGGLLHMGPQSAGADPGPACYGRGGKEPTCTDANLVLGYLSAEYFAGGRMRLEARAAERAIREAVAAPLGMGVLEAAHGMFHVINVNMASAIREISIEKGYDPREFPLICAGGAGPVHGAYIAAELGIRRVIVPRDSPIFCASGMLRTDLKHDYVRSFARLLPERRAALPGVMALAREMEREAREALAAEGIARTHQRFRYSMDLRYLGQYHEVTVAVPRECIARSDWRAVRDRFHARHDRLYGYALREEATPVELLSIRLGALGVTAKPALARSPRAKTGARAALKAHRPVYLPERARFSKVPVYDGDRLTHGNRLAGPAIIESVNTSVFVPRGWRAQYDALDNCILSA
ncbi:MAG: 5-oxoprolinase [Betaproteobacteria bacterium RIFCSPHIGHO2_12_FULL_69_13]|nr:MAG: 5-oxoprolinase [Betaproteobacteria bacterium RIFCSPHIGHO2_12_FULL_69_13]OGA71044.1 MAG: 5-oxoprolinase [Betaproteobacteria bacterium RIFCSPLOWO2_12_FULL_68_20]